MDRVRTMGLLFAAGSCVSGAMAQVTLEKVISNADPVPSLPGAVWSTSTAPYCFINGASIDQNGNTAFRGVLLVGQGGVTSGSSDLALYGPPSSLQYLARTGDQAPGLPAGASLTAFQSNVMPLSASGLLWLGGLCSPSPSGFISTGPFGGLTRVVRNGDTMPGGDVLSANPGSTGTNSINVNSNGQIAFNGQIGTGPFVAPAVYVGGPGTLQLAFKTGVPYASLPSSNSFATTGNVFLNGQGSISCSAYLTQGGTVTDANDEVAFTRAFGAAPGSFNVMALEGDVAPGCGGATFIRGQVDPILGLERQVFRQFAGNFNNQGHAIFSAGLEGDGVVTANNVGLWWNDGTTTMLLRRMGDPTTAVPGATLSFSGGYVSNQGNEAARVRLNNSDQVVWNATLTQGVGGVTAGDDNTLLRTTLGSGTDMLLAREGSPVTDPATGAVIIPGAFYGSTFSGIQQNNRGQIIFIATLADDPNDQDDNVTSSNNQALMAWDPVRGLILVYRKGDDLASVGVPFIPDNINLGGSNANAEGGSNSLSDSGWLAFGVSAFVPGSTNSAVLRARLPVPCYANCDGSTTQPVLNVSDFTCFLQKFAGGNAYANCDGSTTQPVLNVSDFTCFLQKFAAGCSAP